MKNIYFMSFYYNVDDIADWNNVEYKDVRCTEFYSRKVA